MNCCPVRVPPRLTLTVYETGAEESFATEIASLVNGKNWNAAIAADVNAPCENTVASAVMVPALMNVYSVLIAIRPVHATVAYPL